MTAQQFETVKFLTQATQSQQRMKTVVSGKDQSCNYTSLSNGYELQCISLYLITLTWLPGKEQNYNFKCL